MSLQHSTSVQRRIVCPAIRDAMGTGGIICCVHDADELMYAQVAASKGDWSRADQGFMDNYGQFVSRAEAWGVAAGAGQIIYDRVQTPGRLFSAYLY